MAILCSQATYLSSIEFRLLKLADVILLGDVRMSHEPFGPTAFVVQSPNNDKVRAQIKVFNDAYVITVLYMLRDENKRQMTNT